MQWTNSKRVCETVSVRKRLDIKSHSARHNKCLRTIQGKIESDVKTLTELIFELTDNNDK
jgi:hypothetical protein